MKPCYFLFASRPWLVGMEKRLEQATGCIFHLVQSPQELAAINLEELNPRYIFVPHWSWIIPESIWRNHETVIFHMTDLPFGRGGSPLQNLIERGIEHTQISALRCTAELDAGSVYLKSPLSLQGSAQEIFKRAVPITEEMILHIINKELKPTEQQGDPTFFIRRTPKQSDISNITELTKIYDHIRMLDAEGYPHAFLEHNAMRLEFTQAYMEDGKLTAQVNIALKDKDDD